MCLGFYNNTLWSPLSIAQSLQSTSMNHAESQGHTWALSSPRTSLPQTLKSKHWFSGALLSNAHHTFSSVTPRPPVPGPVHWFSFGSSTFLSSIYTSLDIILESVSLYPANASSLTSLLPYQVRGAGQLTKCIEVRCSILFFFKPWVTMHWWIKNELNLVGFVCLFFRWNRIE